MRILLQQGRLAYCLKPDMSELVDLCNLQKTLLFVGVDLLACYATCAQNCAISSYCEVLWHVTSDVLMMLEHQSQIFLYYARQLTLAILHAGVCTALCSRAHTMTAAAVRTSCNRQSMVAHSYATF